MEEIHFHLSQQPVFPSKVNSVLHKIRVKTTRTLKIADMGALQNLGVTVDDYSSFNYERTQEIGDAASFLGFDGILAPSARWPCHNLILFSDRFGPADLTIVSSERVDWAEWRTVRIKLRETAGGSQ
jgi:hypothetical protein